jgi:hypothetical protein
MMITTGRTGNMIVEPKKIPKKGKECKSWAVRMNSYTAKEA